MAESLTIALSKGRILKDTLPLLAESGITPLDSVNTSRKLILGTNLPDVNLVIVRATDVPTYVEFGAADIGVTGKDVLMEHGGAGLYEVMDLKIAQCRLVVAEPKALAKGDASESWMRLRIATKYVNTARQFFANKGIQTEIIKLYGSMELAPLSGLSDRIVDLVDTGSTLRANGLVEVEQIAEISARLIVNKASMKLKRVVMQSFIDQMDLALQRAQN
ncbi:ATP phosphoribosyltransferase [Pseudomonadota bacterium]